MAEQTRDSFSDKLRSNFARDLADRLIAGVKQNHTPFAGRGVQLPFNPISGKRFYGANLLSLMLTPYQDPRWYSFDAVKEMKGDISGQKGTPCLYWTDKWETVTRTKTDANGQPVLDDKGHPVTISYRKRTLTPKRFIVFNAEQISNVELPALAEDKQTADLSLLDSLIKACPVKFSSGAEDIYFSAKDEITLKDSEDPQRYQKAVEMLARWTGHSSRLNRDISGLFGGVNDAKEELRAKLVAMLVYAQNGLALDPFAEENQAYVKTWEDLLKKDPCEILRITKDSEVIFNFLQSMQTSLAVALDGRGVQDDVSAMYKDLNLKNWSGQVLVRPEFVHEDKCETVMDPKLANQFSIYAIGNDGKLNFVAKAQTAEEAEKFADKLTALHESGKQVKNEHQNARTSEAKAPAPKIDQKQTNKPEKTSGKRFWLGNVYDKDRQKFFEKINKIKQAGGKFDTNFKRWYLPEGVDPEPLKEFWPKKKLNPRQEVNAMDARSDLRQALTDMRFKLGNDDPIMDGQIHRVPLMDDKPGQRSGSYIGYVNQGNGWPYARIENFRTGEVRHWKANGTGRFVSDTEKERLAEEAVRIKEKRLQELQAQYESVAIDCQREYQESVLATQPTPYLQRKGIDGDDFKQLQGVKLDAKGNLIVPLQDAEGKIWSIEKIHANGFKSLAKGGQKSGHFSIIETAAQKDQGLDKASVVLICEGYATGVSLALTLKQPVVMAVDAGNLPGVAKALREKYPDKAFLICGDDDRDNKVNKGREKALEAAEAIGAEVVFPVFAEGENGKDFTDFNDLATKSRLGKIGLEQQVAPVIEKILSDRKAQAQTQAQSQARVKRI